MPPSLAKKLKAAGWSYEAMRFQVFGRDGLACHECGTRIVRQTKGSRNLFQCQVCQSD